MSEGLKVVHKDAYGGGVLSHPNWDYELRRAAAGDVLH